MPRATASRRKFWFGCESRTWTCGRSIEVRDSKLMRLNTTWMIYLCTLMLMTTGIVMVYSSSAAIAARETMRKATESGRDLKETETIAKLTTHSTYYLQRQVIFAAIAVVAMLLM